MIKERRSWKFYYKDIIDKYDRGLSSGDIAKEYGCDRGTIKNILIRKHKLRSQSDAAKLAMSQGKKNKALKALIHSAKTYNRFNPKKAHYGPDNYKWVKDRSLIKDRRGRTEEKIIEREIISERGFNCELTGISGKEEKLSIHHIKPVWKYLEYRYDKNNCILILRKIHMYFHRTYGMKSDENDWNKFIKGKEYEPIF